jgi:hypothetical protein
LESCPPSFGIGGRFALEYARGAADAGSGDEAVTSTILDHAEHWHGRATAARLVADQLDDPEAKAAMLSIAAQYDRLAKAARQRADKRA